MALGRAFKVNKRDPYIAGRLAAMYEKRGDLTNASEVLTTALESSRGDKQLNYQYATVLRRSDLKDVSPLIYHYRRAFTNGDTNYEAQFWFARFAFESAETRDRGESKEAFRRLRQTPMAHASRVEIRDWISVDGQSRWFIGKVVRLEYAYGFIEMEGAGDWIFLHKADNGAEGWADLRQGDRVRFNIGFSFNGAVALSVEAV